MWIIYALLSALFAAATSILAKLGIENVNLKEALTAKTVIGGILITIGTFVLIL